MARVNRHWVKDDRHWGAARLPGRENQRVISIIPLALAAAFYPTLLAGVIVILDRDKPVALLAAFLAGGMLISVAAGLIIVFILDGAVSTKHQHKASPAVDLIIAALSFGLAVFLWRRERAARQARRTGGGSRRAKGPSWTERRLGTGSAWVAFGAGVALNLPGLWYLDALKDIARAQDSTIAAILWILVFVVIMFALAEIPLIGYVVSPDATQARVQRLRAWLNEHGRMLGLWVAVAAGVYLTAKGVLALS
jgi:hypothetical protein